MILLNYLQVMQWKRTENATFGDLRLRRPKIQVVLGLSKQSTTYDAIKWALDHLRVETIHAHTTDSCINACVKTIPGSKNSTQTTENNLSATTHNSTPNLSHSNKREAFRPRLVILDLKTTKDFNPENVAR